jgi:hypothetical protein
MDNNEALTYVEKTPDVLSLKKAYDNTLNELQSYFDQCRQNYDDRRNYWPGKNNDMRKTGADAFPWVGASDLEAHVIDERINAYVALFISSMNRANIRAYPVEATDMKRSKLVSGFLKWMISSYIPRFRKEMELCANFMLERGIAITYVGWQREDRSFLQTLNLEQLAQQNPEIAQAVLDGSADEMLIQLLKQTFPSVNDKRAKRALKELRKTGKAEIPIVKRQVDCPLVQTLSPDGDFFFPPYVTDPQRAPYCFWRTFYTPQELLNKVATDGWDADWVEDVIEKYKGVNIQSVEREVNSRRAIAISDQRYEADDLIEVVYAYQRLIDRDDNSEGIYCTVFHKEMMGKGDDKPYAKFELLNGYEDYPVVVTRLFEESKRLYDTQAFPELLRGNQMQVKIERDSRVDRNSMATLPPLMHPIGNAPKDWRPGGFNGYRRAGEVQFGPAPQFPSGSIEMEQTMLKVADGLVGLDPDRIESNDIRRFFVEKWLYHVNEVMKMSYKCFQRFGPDSIWFRVTGVADAQQFNKGDPDENFDIMISYDVLNNDPETMEAKLQAMVSLTQLDKNGLIDVNSLVAMAASAIDPIMADSILQPAQEAQQQVVTQVTDDLAKIYAGIEMPARPNGAQVALEVIGQYAQQPDVTQRLQQDESFKGRIEKYYGQYTFQMQQAQNAEIGKLGTRPASMGQVNTQSIQ